MTDYLRRLFSQDRAALKPLQEIVARADREAGLALLAEPMKNARERLGIGLITVQLPSGVALLRAHSPANHGDNVLSRRQTVKQAIETSKSYTGIEPGRETLSLFSSHPIIHDGKLVGVVDTGINPNLAEFAGRIHPASQDVAANRGIVDSEGHGTAVAGVIGMNRDGSGAMGMAFESRILSLNTANPNDCDEDGCKHSDSAIGRAIDLARVNGAKVINISLGGDGVGGAVLSSVSRAAQAGIVVVVSAGNTGPGAQTVRAPGNVPYVITVGAMTDNFTSTLASDDRLGSFSSAGPTYDRFVKPDFVAPGGHMVGLMDRKAMLPREHRQFLDKLNSKYFEDHLRRRYLA